MAVISLLYVIFFWGAYQNHGRGGEIIEKLTDVMEAGGSFAAALKESGEFPGYMVTMVEIGEASGKLEEVLESLRAYYERNDAVSRSIRSSVIYPLVMISPPRPFLSSSAIIKRASCKEIPAFTIKES